MATRADLEALIEAAIAYLDHLDGDPDFELVGEDVEDACEDEGADVDFPERWDAGTEPSLGSLEQVDQTRWAAGAADDREQGDDDEESLGWQNPMAPRIIGHQYTGSMLLSSTMRLEEERAPTRQVRRKRQSGAGEVRL